MSVMKMMRDEVFSRNEAMNVMKMMRDEVLDLLEKVDIFANH